MPKIISHPIEGNGFGSFHRIKEHGLGVHNTALVILGESGLFPFLAFLFFVFIYFKKSHSFKEIGLKFYFISSFLTFLIIPFLTSHNALDERLSNTILAFNIVIINVGYFRKTKATN